MFTVLALIVVASVSATAYAEPFGDQARQFAYDRYADGRLLIEGAREPTQTVIPMELDCVALYERRIGLRRELDDHQPAYWDDRRNQAAVFLGTVWTPAFYFLGYSAVSAHLTDLRKTDPQREIDALSYAAAARRCFER